MIKFKILKYILFTFYNVEETKVVNDSYLTAEKKVCPSYLDQNKNGNIADTRLY